MCTQERQLPSCKAESCLQVKKSLGLRLLRKKVVLFISVCHHMYRSLQRKSLGSRKACAFHRLLSHSKDNFTFFTFPQKGSYMTFDHKNSVDSCPCTDWIVSQVHSHLSLAPEDLSCLTVRVSQQCCWNSPRSHGWVIFSFLISGCQRAFMSWKIKGLKVWFKW
jgi:hypothetical protein